VLSEGWYSGKGKDVRKVCGRLNMVEILCTHLCKWKNETYGKYSKNWDVGDKGESWRGEFNYFIWKTVL
jgi:hypothetical protein